MKKFLTAMLCMMLVLCLAGSAMATVLRPGHRGTAVRQVQDKLNELGYASLVIDGVYGKKTTEAVKLFQMTNGLKQDGIAGPKTLKKLLGKTDLDDGPNPFDPDEYTLRKGSNGPRVKALQQKLRKLGYLKTVADGYYGDSTVAAVRSFQSLNGLGVDGIAGAATLDKIDASDVVAYYVPSKYATLRPGMAGDKVLKLQKKLATLGYPVSATGYYNVETTEAVRAFQIDNGLTVDGIAGQKTQAAMFGK